MKKFGPLFALSVSTAILCGLWAVFATQFELIIWAGFAGCTTYFSTKQSGLVGLRKTILPNLAGVLCGMAVILLGSWVPALGEWGVWCTIITFVMCIISYFDAFDYCPGIFMGCFCTTAVAQDEWKIFVASLLIGAFLGLGCDLGGKWLYKLASKKK